MITQLLDWLTKYPPPVVLLIVFVAALLFVTKLVGTKHTILILMRSLGR